MILYEINQHISQLLEDYENGEIEEQAYTDTVEALGSEIGIDEAVKAIRELETYQDACKNEAAYFAEKAKKAENRIGFIKNLIIGNMNLTDSKKVSAGVFTVSKRFSESADIQDINAIPAEFLIPQPDKPDKKSILKRLKDGEEISGAVLRKSAYIVIK